MRWERLFDDLEAGLDEHERALVDTDVADLVRAERGRVALSDRLRAHLGAPLVWTVLSTGDGGDVLHGEPVDVGTDWVLIRSGRNEILLRLAGVESVTGLSRTVAPDPGEVTRRLRISTILRGLARDRAVVLVRLGSGRRITGTIDRVGQDHVDLAVHPLDQPRRSEGVLEVRSILLSAVVSVAVS
jgi:hypothetical protein